MPISTDDTTKSNEVEHFVASVTTSLPASSGRQQVHTAAQDADPVCIQVKEYCRKGWPERKQEVALDIRPYIYHDDEYIRYYIMRESLTIVNNLLMFNNCIVVPPSLRDEILRKIHTGHQGIERC